MFRYKKLSGAFTIEASVIIPLACFLFAGIIHLSFWMYGRALLAQDSYLLALRASLIKTEEDAGAYVAERYAAQVKGRYFGNKKPEISGAEEGDNVKVKGKTETNHSARNLLWKEEWHINSRARAIDIDVPARIRKIDRIADLGKMALEKTGK